MPSRTPYLAAALAVAFTLSTGALALAQTAPATPATPAATTAPVKTKHSKKTAAADASTGMAAPMTSSKLPADEQFSTVTAATAHCPGDTVVWSTMSKSKSFHLAASKYYGKTKHGAYACEKDLTAAGFHASKS